MRAIATETLLFALAALASCHGFLFQEDDTEAVPSCWMHRAVWTGKEMLVSCGGTFLRYDPAADAWAGLRPQVSVGSTRQEYQGPDGESAVWTGTELILWGGTVYQGSWSADQLPANEGHRYNPATNDFRLISGLGAPAPRRDHSAIWTGTEMVVWGGNGGSKSSQSWLGTGGRYDPKTDTWRALSDTGAPAPRYMHAAVWGGTEMLVWGGNTNNGDDKPGGRYDPATDTWTPISASGQPRARDYPGAVWDGTGLIVAGGLTRDTSGPYAARYAPSSDTWTSLPDPPNANYEENYPLDEWFPALVWTGQGLVIWRSPGGARYDPVAWDKLSPQGEHVVVPPSGFTGMSGVWTGTEVIIWGGRSKSVSGDNSDYRTGLRYDPTTGSWRPTSVVMPRLDRLDRD